MKIKEIMTENPQFCTPDDSVMTAAGKMKEYNCGAIPVVDNLERRRPVGIITDRDIVIRCVAENASAAHLRVEDCMTRKPCTTHPESDVEEAILLMEKHKVRRIPVVDRRGALCGMVVQAHIARSVPQKEIAEVLATISQP